MATDTGAVDAANGNAPLVFDGAGANAATAIENGIRTLANGLPLDINAVSTDDPSRRGRRDRRRSSITSRRCSSAPPQCANGLTDIDTNGDTFKDKYLQVRTGTPVCWKVVSKQNTTVPATDVPQLFRATVTRLRRRRHRARRRDVFFLVPPKPADVPVN